MTLKVMQVVHQGGGAGSVTSTLHLSLGLQAAGVDVTFVCPPGSEVEALAYGGGLRVHPLALEPGERRANAAALARAPAASRRRSGELPERARPQALVRSRGRRLGVPLVLTRRQIPRTFVLENWLASRAADRIVAVSHAVAAALRRRGRRPGSSW